MKKPNLVKSISYSQNEILSWIMQLYDIKQFDLDPTYSKGIFYKNIPEPRLKFDLNPQVKGCKKADCTDLPLDNNSIDSIVFDPPFIFGRHGGLGTKVMERRFSSFENFEQLKQIYQNSMMEFYRILKKKGILVFKCQDFTDSKTTMTHCLVWQWATETGFYAKDLFILASKNRIIYKPNSKQHHARKFHSYLWIFQK